AVSFIFGTGSDEFAAAESSYHRHRDGREHTVQQTSTHIKQIGRVIIPVSDQDKALEFYTGTLGFEVRADIAFGEGDRWLEVGPPGAGAALALMPPRPGNP